VSSANPRVFRDGLIKIRQYLHLFHTSSFQNCLVISGCTARQVPGLSSQAPHCLTKCGSLIKPLPYLFDPSSRPTTKALARTSNRARTPQPEHHPCTPPELCARPSEPPKQSFTHQTAHPP
jgi:hypothetical protein